MILKDAIRYLELNKTDFITDLNDYGKLQKDYAVGVVPNDFTERYEEFENKLLILYFDSFGGLEKAENDGISIPSHNSLIKKYCSITFESGDTKKEETETFFKSSLLVRKKDTIKENKTLELLAFLTNSELGIEQFYNVELDVIYKVLDIVAEKRKEEEKKRKRRK